MNFAPAMTDAELEIARWWQAQFLEHYEPTPQRTQWRKLERLFGKHPPTGFNGARMLDHEEVWKHRETGRLVVVSHPYADYADVLAEIASSVKEMHERGCDISVSMASWYYPGRTVRIDIHAPVGWDGRTDLSKARERALLADGGAA